MDLVLGPYADTHTDSMDDSQLDRLEALMSEEDPPLLTWVMGQETPPDHVDKAFLAEVIADHQARVGKRTNWSPSAPRAPSPMYPMACSPWCWRG